MVQQELEVETDTVYVPSKVSKIRWHPSPFSQEESGHKGLMAVGTYDEVVNRVVIYSLNIGASNNPTQMTRLSWQNIKGGVADLKFVPEGSHSTSLLLASTFNGDLNIYNTNNLEKKMQLNPDVSGYGAYPNLEFHRSLHLHQGSLTSMDITSHREVATGGSDGDVKIVDLENFKELRKIAGDGIPINCVKYTSTSIVTASNQIKLLDTRSNAQTKIRNDKGVPFQSIAPHPHQGNFLCSGSYDGVVNVWDLRSSTIPISSLNSHSDHVWELQFLPGRSGGDETLLSTSSSLLSLTLFNPTRVNAHEFGAHVRAHLPKSISLPRQGHNLNTCDSHAGGSGLVAAAGDSGSIILARLNEEMIMQENINNGNNNSNNRLMIENNGNHVNGSRSKMYV